MEAEVRSSSPTDDPSLHMNTDKSSSPSESRRGFLVFFVRAVAALIVLIIAVPAAIMAVAPALLAGKRQKRKVVFKNPADRNSTTFVAARIEGQEETAPGIFLKTENGQVTALYARCTHAACAVNWNEGSKQFECPCHGGKFDASGKVVAGPPPKPLERLIATVQGQDVLVEEPEA